MIQLFNCSFNFYKGLVERIEGDLHILTQKNIFLIDVLFLFILNRGFKIFEP